MTHDSSDASDIPTKPSRRGVLKAAAWAPSLAAAASGLHMMQGFTKAANAQASDMTELGAREAVSHIKSGDITAEAYMSALLKHHEAHKNLNAFITLNEDRVLQEARAVDQARTRGETLGPLAGLPVVIKDQIDVAGYPTTVGSNVLHGYIAQKNAVVVETMVKAGAVMMAKTAMSDLITGGGSGRYFPTPRNPYDVSRVTGGSSTGVGAAIGARIAPAGIGEDSYGSIRWPSAWCGIAGLRPSGYAMENYLNGTDRKRYSGIGMVPPTNWVDTMGPMARTVADVAFLDTAITGESVPRVNLRGTRLGIPRADYWEERPHDPLVRRTIEAGFAKLREAGAVLVEVDLNGLIELSEKDRLSPAVAADRDPEMVQWLAENHPSVTIKDIQEQRANNRRDIEPRNYVRSVAPPPVRPNLSPDEEKKMVGAAWEHYSGAFKNHSIVALAMPTLMILPSYVNFNGYTRAQKILVNGEWVEEWDLILTNIWWTTPFGAPALSLPAGLASGLPVGLQLQGMPGSDSAILGLGLEVEKVLGELPPPTFRHVPL